MILDLECAFKATFIHETDETFCENMLRGQMKLELNSNYQDNLGNIFNSHFKCAKF